MCKRNYQSNFYISLGVGKGELGNRNGTGRNGKRSICLMYQIAGEEIPSVISDEYRCQAIQFYDMELKSIKDAAYLASMYQKMIKPLCCDSDA